ncbi:hypothetical protein BOTBODRAFT_369534 [Botryobasidium botryosum FD-172 SS1]|uniref:Uncharacterized protein n=1 Tax=Botryobasidium botryosum (strain FD-172 SS1) TaxID=930990 RepID=A0A067MPJ1_BOTB1|nr:hypothetical protein BOTBODRAFT_369534 [Botryobasidium botryosum FD-172 SS1]
MCGTTARPAQAVLRRPPAPHPPVSCVSNSNVVEPLLTASNRSEPRSSSTWLGLRATPILGHPRQLQVGRCRQVSTSAWRPPAFCAAVRKN